MWDDLVTHLFTAMAEPSLRSIGASEQSMLVLSRKSGERIHIGNNVTIEVRRVAGNRVTLAVQAPKEVRILRGELREAAQSFETEPAPQEPVKETITLSEPEAMALAIAAGVTA